MVGVSGIGQGFAVPEGDELELVVARAAIHAAVVEDYWYFADVGYFEGEEVYVVFVLNEPCEEFVAGVDIVGERDIQVGG